MRHVAGGRHHFRKGRGDVIEVPRVKDDTVAFLVQLATDAVVFVLDPRLAADPAHDGRRILFRGGEHELQRVHQPQLCRPERSAPGPHRDLADVTRQHPRPGDFGQRRAEGLGDPLFDQAGAQPDAQIAGQDLADILRLARGQPVEQFAQRLGLLLDGALFVDPDEGLVDIAQ